MKWKVVLAMGSLVTAIAYSVVGAGNPIVVTVQELIERNHRIEVRAGTEIVWGDPHFDRVWFPPRTGARGFHAVFSKPGTYRGTFTIAGGHRSNDVYPLIVTVTDR